MFAVAVSYGTWRRKVLYSRNLANRADARRMVGTAVDHGYADAEIVDQDEWLRRNDE